MAKTYKSYAKFLLISLNICWGTFLMGYFIVVYNPVQLSLQYEYHWFDASSRNIYEGFITAVVPLGAAFGSFLSPYVFQRIGRKTSCFLLDFLCFLGSGLTEISDVPLLITGRLLCGITVGANSILVGLYIREICPVELSDFFGSLGNFSLNVGIFVCFLLGLRVKTLKQLDSGETDAFWRVMFGFPAICCLLRSFCLRVFFNYESPVFLLEKRREDEAMHVLKSLYKEEHAQEIYEKTSLRVDALRKRKNTSFLRGELLNKRYSLRLLLGFSQVFANQFSGMPAISFYSKKLFLNIGFSEEVANYANIGIGGVSISSIFLLALLIKRLGKRLTYLLSLLLLTLCLCLISLFAWISHEIPVIVLTFLFNLSYNLGCGPIIFMIIPQILPERLIGMVFIGNWVFAIVVGFCFPKMMDSEMDVYGCFLLFAGCVFATFVFNLAFLKETAGKTNAEISNVYMRVQDFEEKFAPDCEGEKDFETK